MIGVTDAVDCFTKGDIGGRVNTILNVIPWGIAFKALKIGEAAWRVGRAVVRFLGELKWAERILAKAERAATKVPVTGLWNPAGSVMWILSWPDFVTRCQVSASPARRSPRAERPTRRST
ncbi:hypothetical protein [Dactylosporangium darangshiense]|uniref:Uncharacterized protein n=1 Tax=Dactylosporangium darangshiense TaxID=579108 RepID=A0ABP8DFC1_9ACTN